MAALDTTVTVGLEVAVPKRKPFWKSHKVWGATLASMIVVVEHYALGGTMPVEKIVLMMIPFLSLLGIEGAADIVKVYREWKTRLEPLAKLLPRSEPESPATGDAVPLGHPDGGALG